MIYLLTEERLDEKALKQLTPNVSSEEFFSELGSESHYDFTQVVFGLVYHWGGGPRRQRGNPKLYSFDDVALDFFLLTNQVPIYLALRVEAVDFLTEQQILWMHALRKMSSTLNLGIKKVVYSPKLGGNKASKAVIAENEKKNLEIYERYLKRKEQMDSQLLPRLEAIHELENALLDSIEWIIEPTMHTMNIAPPEKLRDGRGRLIEYMKAN